MATRTIGTMQEFNPANESVTAYLERFQLFASANAIEDDKMVPTLLTVVGSTHYSLLRGLVSPDLPKDKSFDGLVALLKKHYDPEAIFDFGRTWEVKGHRLTPLVQNNITLKFL